MWRYVVRNVKWGAMRDVVRRNVAGMVRFEAVWYCKVEQCTARGAGAIRNVRYGEE